MQYGVIYILINKINNKVYIGQTVGLRERMYKYSGLHCEGQTKLHRALLKYGWDNFESLILETGRDEEDLHQLEDYYIDLFKSVEFGYNCKGGGKHGKPGKETKKRMSESGKKRPPPSEETRKKISGSQRGELGHWFGKKLPETTCKKMSESHLKNGTSGFHKSISKAVVCIETNIEYMSGNKAAREMNIPPGNLHRNLRGEIKSVKGYTFRYVDKK